MLNDFGKIAIMHLNLIPGLQFDSKYMQTTLIEIEIPPKWNSTDWLYLHEKLVHNKLNHHENLSIMQPLDTRIFFPNKSIQVRPDSKP